METQNNEISQSNEKISLLEKQLEELEQERSSKLELEGSQQGLLDQKQQFPSKGKRGTRGGDEREKKEEQRWNLETSTTEHNQTKENISSPTGTEPSEEYSRTLRVGPNKGRDREED